jgi:hypothetical protein
MKLHLDWSRAVPLRDGTKDGLIYSVDVKKLPETHGIYVFGRWKRDGNIEALYVGQAAIIRDRVQSHLKSNVRLMQHLKKARQGQRIVLAARFVARPGQKPGKSLPIMERALIRYFLSEGHDLVNKQGTHLRQHEIACDGKQPRRFIPKVMFLEKARGE